MLKTLDTPLYVLLRWEEAGRAARINNVPRERCPTSLREAKARWNSGWLQEDMRIKRLEESARMVMGEQP